MSKLAINGVEMEVVEISIHVDGVDRTALGADVADLPSGTISVTGTMTRLRTPCAVVFCSRSIKGGFSWWLCAEHKRMVPMWVKARHRRLKAYFRRRGEVGQDTKAWWCLTDRAKRVMDAAGREIIRAANKRASGL